MFSLLITLFTLLFDKRYCNLLTKFLVSGGMKKVAVNIRMPNDMRKAIVEIAETEFRSVNSLILQLLDEALRAKNVEWRIEED